MKNSWELCELWSIDEPKNEYILLSEDYSEYKSIRKDTVFKLAKLGFIKYVICKEDYGASRGYILNQNLYKEEY